MSSKRIGGLSRSDIAHRVDNVDPAPEFAPSEQPFGHVERAGQRLFRELVPGRVIWSTVSEAERLIDADLVALLLPVAQCDHTEPCALTGCQESLQVHAVIGNRALGTPSVSVPVGHTAAGRAYATRAVALGGIVGAPDEVCPIALGESMLYLVGIPIVFDEDVFGAMLIGRRAESPWHTGEIDRMRRFTAFAATALCAARDRSSAEEVAVARDRHVTARELHDNVGQLMFRVGVSARLARESVSTGRDDALKRLQDVEQLVGRATATLRHTMRVLDNSRSARVAVAASISEEIETVRQRAGIDAHLLTVGEPRSMPAEIESLVLRIAAEGLRNVERHSEAREAVVSLCFDEDRVSVAVQDNGVGLARGSDEGTGLGIRRLQEACRAHDGDLVLGRNEDGGVTLRAWMGVDR